MDNQPVRPSCPFCAFTAASESPNDMYFLLQHLELSHPENGESPFIAIEDGSASPPEDKVRQSSGTSESTASAYEEEDVYVQCPGQCGESVILAELPNHMDLHGAEDMASFDLRSSSISQDGCLHLLKANPSDVQSNVQSHSPPSSDVLLSTPCTESFHASSDQRPHKASLGPRNWREALLGRTRKKTKVLVSNSSHVSARRLGVSLFHIPLLPTYLSNTMQKSELGPHAFEERMPAWLLQQLQQGPRISSVNQLDHSGRLVRVEIVANETPDILPVLAQLCEQDRAVSKAFFCHAGVKHVFKMAREGGFCGYRNLQMMISFIQATRFPGYEHFPGRTPSILLLQDLIERAWDQGINSSGRVETGGIKGTRKYIGTPEVSEPLCPVLAVLTFGGASTFMQSKNWVFDETKTPFFIALRRLTTDVAVKQVRSIKVETCPPYTIVSTRQSFSTSPPE